MFKPTPTFKALRGSGHSRKCPEVFWLLFGSKKVTIPYTPTQNPTLQTPLCYLKTKKRGKVWKRVAIAPFGCLFFYKIFLQAYI